MAYMQRQICNKRGQNKQHLIALSSLCWASLITLRTGTGRLPTLPTHPHTTASKLTTITAHTCMYMYGCNKIWSFCRADLQGCLYCTLQGHRPHTCMYMYSVQHVWQTTVPPTCFCTLYKYMDVTDSQQNYAYRMWGVLET